MDGELKIPDDSPPYLAHLDFNVKLTHECGIPIRAATTFEAEFQMPALSPDSDIPEFPSLSGSLSGGPRCGFWRAQPSSQHLLGNGGRIHKCSEQSASLFQGHSHPWVFTICCDYNATINWSRLRSTSEAGNSPGFSLESLGSICKMDIMSVPTTGRIE